ncbi:MAG: hypothetical protein JWO94_2271 [Verrucomicrobiaceae bacterium]|nr:hypothetical protein [Verrucomicrobiaceae bacterium]
MKVFSIFIAAAALSSCVAKPWMVGSVNDHYTMKSYEAGEKIKIRGVGEPEPRHGTIFHPMRSQTVETSTTMRRTAAANN